MTRKRFLLALAGCLSVAAPSQAFEPPRHQSLDEVLVRGKRAALSELREQMVGLEDQYYELYNELNKNDLFDIHCAMEARSGTLIRRRYCRAVYEARAFEREGREHYQALPKYSDPTPRPWVPPAPAIIDIERRRKEFRKTMLDVTSSSPELVELLRQRAELAELYEATRREIFNRDDGTGDHR